MEELTNAKATREFEGKLNIRAVQVLGGMVHEHREKLIVADRVESEQGIRNKVETRLLVEHLPISWWLLLHRFPSIVEYGRLLILLLDD